MGTVERPFPPPDVSLSHSSCGPIVVESDKECVSSDEADSRTGTGTIDLGRGVHRAEEGDRAAERARAEGSAQDTRRPRAGAGSQAPQGGPPLEAIRATLAFCRWIA